MKPILFNTEMVRAILNGRKTVTRRLLKPRYLEGEAGFQIITNKHTGEFVRVEIVDEYEEETRWLAPPYLPGDILYVRETWHKDTGRYMFKANYSDTEKFYRNGKEVQIKWRPSIHMPKEATRIFLRVKNVWAEQLQKITVNSIEREGIQPRRPAGMYGIGCRCSSYVEGCLEAPCPNRDAYIRLCYVTAFSELWDSTIKASDRDSYGWPANPWVWVIEFERIEHI